MGSRLTCLCLLVVAGTDLSAKEPRQVRETGDAFVGSINCKSSSCHGGAGLKRSQYTTWTQQDFHNKAYVVLLGARSERMAESLGIGRPESSVRCTVCHSPLQSVAKTRVANTARSDEGVSCESCHGAASGWLRGHTRADWTYSVRIGAGMHDLRSLYVRANTCVACHQNLSAELLGAGHPELFFELNGQSVAEPKHWQDEDPWSGVREWLTGQAVALREASASLSDDQVDPESLARWNALAWICATAASAKGVPSPVNLPSAEPEVSEFVRMKNESDSLARHISVSTWNKSSVRSLLNALAAMEAEFPAKGTSNKLVRQRAKRLVLGLDRLVFALNQNCGACLKLTPQVDQLFQDITALEAFDPIAFADHLRTFRVALEENR